MVLHDLCTWGMHTANLVENPPFVQEEIMDKNQYQTEQFDPFPEPRGPGK